MSKISKLGLGIVAFEGVEHIKNITSEVRDLVDHITVCLQKISYRGIPIDENDVKVCERLKELGLIDSIIWFDFDQTYLDKAKAELEGKIRVAVASKNYQLAHDLQRQLGDAPRSIECDKRNFILDYLEKEVHCSHSLVTDSDEFYVKDDFERGKYFIGLDSTEHVTYCQYVNYWRDYRHFLVWPFDSFVPFIGDSKFRFKFHGRQFNGAIDPTRVWDIEPPTKYTIFKWDVTHMNHFSWIRLDINKKIDAWSSNGHFTPEHIEYVKKRFANWKEYENAKLAFGTPDNEVNVTWSPVQYVHPKYKIYEEI